MKIMKSGNMNSFYSNNNEFVLDILSFDIWRTRGEQQLRKDLIANNVDVGVTSKDNNKQLIGSHGFQIMTKER